MLIGLGALLMLAGVVLTAVSTLRRGKLSEPRPRPETPRDTLEPRGQGRRLSLRADLPGIALFAAGAVLLLIAAAMRSAG